MFPTGGVFVFGLWLSARSSIEWAYHRPDRYNRWIATEKEGLKKKTLIWNDFSTQSKDIPMDGVKQPADERADCAPIQSA